MIKSKRQLQAIMKTADGREWMWDHLARCNVFAQTYTSDTHDTAFNEGRRSIGLRLLADLQEHVFTQYQQMEAEAMARLEDENDKVENDVSETD